MKSRPGWYEYFMTIADLASTRSTCTRRKVGAVLVRENNILATGYNGAPRGVKHCIEVGCLREKHKIPSGERTEMCRGLHAEQNLLVQAARHGVQVKDAILFCNFRPCITCTKMIINAGIKKVIYREQYHDSLAEEMAVEAGLKLEQLTLVKPDTIDVSNKSYEEEIKAIYYRI